MKENKCNNDFIWLEDEWAEKIGKDETEYDDTLSKKHKRPPSIVVDHESTGKSDYSL